MPKLCSPCTEIPAEQHVTRRTITIDLFCDFDEPADTLDSVVAQLQEVLTRASGGSAAESRVVVEADKTVERDEAPCMNCGGEHEGGCDCETDDDEDDAAGGDEEGEDDRYDDRRDYDHDLLSHEVDSDPYDSEPMQF